MLPIESYTNVTDRLALARRCAELCSGVALSFSTEMVYEKKNKKNQENLGTGVIP